MRRFLWILLVLTLGVGLIGYALGRGWLGVRQIINGHRKKGYCVIDAHNTLRSRVVARGLGGVHFHRRTVEAGGRLCDL